VPGNRRPPEIIHTFRQCGLAALTHFRLPLIRGSAHK